MRKMSILSTLVLACGALASVAMAQPEKTAPASPSKPAQPENPKGIAPTPPPEPQVQIEAVDLLRKDAGAIRPLIKSHDVQRTLVATTWLPVIDPRTLYMDSRGTKWYLPEEFAALTEEQKSELKAVEFDGRRFYYTKYGSPMAFMRPLDIVAETVGGEYPLRGKRILDYGYGSIGHLRLMASQNMDVVGVDVDEMLKKLYSNPEDQGAVEGAGMSDVPGPGKLTLVHGYWPKDAETVKQVGGNYDFIVSKNTLKKGYVTPEHPVPKGQMVDLGVEPEAFVTKVAESLRPGGLFLIYNICPAQKADGYLAMADGRSPFSKEMVEKAGFEVVEFNKDDSETARKMGAALGWDKGARPMNLEKDLFATYTLLRKKAEPATPAK